MFDGFKISLTQPSAFIYRREVSSEAILEALRDETMNDPRERIEMAHNHTFYRPSLLGQL